MAKPSTIGQTIRVYPAAQRDQRLLRFLACVRLAPARRVLRGHMHIMNMHNIYREARREFTRQSARTRARELALEIYSYSERYINYNVNTWHFLMS